MDGDPTPAWGTGFQTTFENLMTNEFRQTGWQRVPQRPYYIKFLINASNAVYGVYIAVESPSTKIHIADKTPFNFDSSSTDDDNYSHLIPASAKVLGLQCWSRSGGQVVANGFPLADNTYRSSWNCSTSNNAVYAIHVYESTVAFEFGGESYDPTDHDDRFAERRSDLAEFSIRYGTSVNEMSDYNAHDLIYSTRDYSVKLKWRSPTKGYDYELDLPGYKNIDFLYIDPDTGKWNYSFSPGDSTTMKATRGPLGSYASQADVPSDYEDMTDFPAVKTITLNDLLAKTVEKYNSPTNTVSIQDLCTVMNVEFWADNSDDPPVSEQIDSIQVDFSDLYDTPPDLDGMGEDPNKEVSLVDNNKYISNTPIETPTLSSTGVFNRCYSMDANSVNDLCDYIYNADDSIFEEIMDGVLTGNPMESLIDLRLYPFDVMAIATGGASQQIKFGRVQTPIVGYKLPNLTRCIINLGSAVVPRCYNNFLDYQMDIKLYIPFIGMVDLPVELCLNKHVNVQMAVDFVTGACTAMVYIEGIIYSYHQGVIGISIPMTGTGSSEYAKTMIGNIIGLASGSGKGAAEGVKGMGTVSGAVAGAVKETASNLMDIAGNARTGSHLQTCGASTPQVSLYQPLYCYMLVEIPNPLEGAYDDNYANNVGYACFEPVNSILMMQNKGFTCFENVKLTIPTATDKEKEELLQLLKSGVFM